MFFSLSKTLAKFGGFRLGLGIRLTKKNAPWMFLIWIFVLMFKMMWYMMVISFWLMYAVIYAFVWCLRAPIKAIIKISKPKRKHQENKIR